MIKRKFNGKIYRRLGWAPTKIKATAMKDKIKRIGQKGGLVRVTKTSDGYYIWGYRTGLV